MKRPTLAELGIELTATTPRQRVEAIVFPFVWMAVFLVGWETHYRPIVCPLAILLLFSATSTSAHDVLHGSLGMERRLTEWALFLIGASILESGHAYRATHLEHHRLFPFEGDIEGEAAHMPLWRVLLSGPAFLPRLWLWAWNKRKEDSVERRWLAIEALLPLIALLAGLWIRPVTTGPLAFSGTVLLASWFYPIFAVWLPHREFLETRALPAWTVRGVLFPKLFRPLAYHLEHHLYPRVPSHNLPKLAAKLEPWLRENRVHFVHLP